MPRRSWSSTTVMRRRSWPSWSAAPGIRRRRWTSWPRCSRSRSRAITASVAVTGTLPGGRGLRHRRDLLADHFRRDGAEPVRSRARDRAAPFDRRRARAHRGARRTCDLRDRVAEELDALPVEQREAVRLRVVEGQGYQTLAQRSTSARTQLEPASVVDRRPAYPPLTQRPPGAHSISRGHRPA